MTPHDDSVTRPRTGPRAEPVESHSLADPLATGAVHAHFQYTRALGADALDAAAAVLSDEERARAARFAYDRDRRDFIAAHALLRHVLTSYAPGVAPEAWRFTSDDRGKPALVSSGSQPRPFAVNLSHTRGLVACAVAPAGVDVGVDVESVRDAAILDVADRFFSEAEAAALRRCPAPERPLRFIETWTLKEAVVKAAGTGLFTPLRAFAIEFSGASALELQPVPGEDRSQWTLALFAPRERDRLAVAVRGNLLTPRVSAYRHEPAGAPRPCVLLRSSLL